MAGVALPAWATLKANIHAIILAVAAEEEAIDPARNFLVSKDRWRPWIEKQQNLALVNVLVDSVESDSSRSGSRRYKADLVTVNLDMYALGTLEEQNGELTPADEVAALRLDLLTAQVRSAILRMANQDLGFQPGVISEVQNFMLQIYSQEREEATGQYAPARWSFQVSLPYYLEESSLVPLTELNLEFNQALEAWSHKYLYSPSE